MEKIITQEEITKIFHKPLLDLLFLANKTHQNNHADKPIEKCSLLSVKTGRCSQDCAYCAQSIRYKTNIKEHELLDKKQVLAAAKKSIEMGSSNFCLSLSGKQVKNDEDFEKIIEMIEEIQKLNVRVCCTLGQLNEDQANRLKKANIFSYNHNLDTSPSFYSKIITTRKFEDRLKTISILQKAKIPVCSGGILGMGETEKDRIDFIHALNSLDPHPQSISLNCLIPIAGTPLENQKPISIWELIRVIATIRIVIPKAVIRLAGGRGNFSHQEQLLCFFAGIGSIHIGEKLLTAKNCSVKNDENLFETLGI
jgi:biotin synthase